VATSWTDSVERALTDQDLDGEQIRLLRGCARLIDQLVGAAGPLWSTCCNGGDCWRRVTQERRPDRMEARLPWIGPRYTERRILLIGINSRDAGDALAEIRTIEWVLPALRNGRRQIGGRSSFHFRAAAAADAIIRSQDGRPLELNPAPEHVADALLAAARIQSVQCSPLVGRRGPTPEMIGNCPALLLGPQLELLRTRVVIALGHPAHVGLQRVVPVQWSSPWDHNDACFARGTATIADQQAAVFALHHPASARWTQSFQALIDSLRREPARTAEPS
jgi:hypothetical protein